eukprot:TRINITY_DN19342_c0_g1_i1.p1 TRINITY_DN19342_c0_g1~~TRINITY_DN19342_c0_g1_i1.p1  ORF type:complete len:453 (-),score=115.86 TRINITY_DN19342_c0_g1_i1:84-1442(-)
MKTTIAILLIASLMTIMARPDETKIKAFEEWIKKGSTVFDSDLELGTDRYDQHRTGVFAKEDLDVDEPLMTIPLSQMITIRHIEESDIGPCLWKVWDRFGDGSLYNPAFYEILTLYILHEKIVNPNSEWKAWLDVLPEASEMNNILFWKNSDIKKLEGSPLHKRALDRKAEVKLRYDFMKSTVFRPYAQMWDPEPTEDQYKWAVSIVRSRNLSIRDDIWDAESVKQPALIPYLDMFRHVPLTDDMSLEVYTWNVEAEQMEVKTNASIKSGQEIFISLGEKANSELLDFHGYIIEDNANDCVHLEVELMSDDPLVTTKRVIYQTSMIEPAKVKMMNTGITTELLRAVRAVTVIQDEIHNDMLMGGVGDWSLGPRSDIAIANYISTYCRKAYFDYPNKMEEDEAEAMDPELPERYRMAAKIRTEERNILARVGAYYMHETKRLIEAMNQDHDEL